MKANVPDILNRCPLFEQIEPEGFAQLVAIGRIATFRKGQIVFRQGDPCPGVYVVGEGVVRIYKIGAGGKEHVLHLATAGQSFAEVAALGGFPMPATAEAMSATACALLPAEQFRALLQSDHRLCLGLLAGMARWVRQLVGLLEDIALRDAAGRLARYLLDLPAEADRRVRLPGLKRHVANHLNLTSETFSRTLRRLEEAGLIRQHNELIELCDRKQLQHVADGLAPRL